MMDKQRLFLSPPHMSPAEERLVHEAFQTNFIGPVGPMLQRFEQEICKYTGFKYAVAVASGTAAIHLALRHLGVKRGDLVLASTLTFIGSVSPITFLGAEPIFVDAESTGWNMDPALLAQELKHLASKNRLPKAVIPTDLYGQCCDLPALVGICNEYGIPVICDSAEAMGAEYRMLNTEQRTLSAEEEALDGGEWVHAGYGSYAAVYSFNGNKIITTGGGGILASDNEELIVHARKLATQSRDSALHYEHTEIGYNYRMSNIAAAIGIGQLGVLDERVRKRRQIFEWYRQELSGIDALSFMSEPEWSRSNRWLTVVLIDPETTKARPLDVIEALERFAIESRPVWKPMHLQPVFSGNHCVGRTISEERFGRGVCLPSGSALEKSDVEMICGIIRGIV